MVHITCSLCGFDENPGEVADIWDAMFHEHDDAELRSRYGDELADTYLARLERERPNYLPNPFRAEVS